MTDPDRVPEGGIHPPADGDEPSVRLARTRARDSLPAAAHEVTERAGHAGGSAWDVARLRWGTQVGETPPGSGYQPAVTPPPLGSFRGTAGMLWGPLSSIPAVWADWYNAANHYGQATGAALVKWGYLITGFPVALLRTLIHPLAVLCERNGRAWAAVVTALLVLGLYAIFHH